MSWTDQPHETVGAEQIMTFGTGQGQHAEIRKGKRWYVTIGNLFMSVTLASDSAEAILRGLQSIINGECKDAAIPEGCVLLENSKEPA